MQKGKEGNRSELKDALIKLLEEDKEFRYTVAGLIGYKEVMDRLADIAQILAGMRDRLVGIEERMEQLRKDMVEGFRRHDDELRRHEQVMEQLRKDMVEGFRRHDDELRRHEQIMEQLRKDMIEGFRRHDDELRRHEQVMEQLRKDMIEGFRRLDLKISAIGARWGIMNEQSVRNGLKGILSKDLGYTVEEFKYSDDEGYVYGYPSSVQIDVVVKDSMVIVLEISSHVKRSDPPTVKRKAELYERVTGRSVSKVVIVTPFIDDDAVDVCRRYGIEVYSI
jgi:hypothetical protein